MIFYNLWVDKDVISKYDYKLINIWHVQSVHKIHEHCMHINETKWHNKKLKMVASCSKFFFHIFICCLQLMITRTSHQVVEWVIYYWCPSCWAHGNLYTFSLCHPLWNNFCIVSSTPSFWLVLTSMEVSQSVLSLTSILF